MPRKLATACAVRTCPNLRPCVDHPPKRASRQERGYDAAYDRARRRWAPLVATCRVHCHADICIEASGRLILPHQPWDLGHDGQRHIRGPEHATCNRSAGGKAAHAGS